MNSFKPLAIGVVLAIFAAGCLGGSNGSSIAIDDEATVPAVTEPTADSATSSDDRPCDGGAFPDDEEFRQLLCDLQWAQADLLRDGGEFDISWGGRISLAILLQVDDRPTAVAELHTILAEITAGS